MVHVVNAVDCPVNVWLGNLTALDMALLGWLGRKKPQNKQSKRIIENFLYVKPSNEKI